MSSDPIVAGTDGSASAELAVDKAGELAHALGAPVHVVCVPAHIAGADWPPRITAQQIVADAGEKLRSRGLAVETHLPKDVGEPALALVSVADAVQAQMIVVGNKGMTGVRRFLGSFPNRVSHTAVCDVLIVPTQSPSGVELDQGTLVVGTDGSSGATRAVKEAIRLAKALGAELHIVSSSQSSASAEAALAAAAAEAADEGVNAITHVYAADPADALLEVAADNDAALIVVGSKGMHVDDRERFGNIPDKISHRATCGVLIVFTGDAAGNAREEMTASSSGEAGGP